MRPLDDNFLKTTLLNSIIMEKVSTYPSVHFEVMLWLNELEYHRRELAIFESYLLNKGASVQPYLLTELMGQLHQYMQSVNKMLEDLRPETKVLPLTSHYKLTGEGELENPNPHIREEIFYFGKSYRQFKHAFCSFAEGLEVA